MPGLPSKPGRSYFFSQGSEPMRSIAQSDGRNAPGFDEAVTVVAAVRDDIVVVLEDPVGEPVVVHELA
jgi:hypothetical protein